MANITELNAPTGLTIQPDERAAQTAREAGRTKDVLIRESARTLGGAISHVGGQVGEQIDQHVAAQWIGHGAATSASLHSDFVQQWNKLASETDPNDSSVAQGFKEKILEPSLENFIKGFDGAPDKAQQWALTRADKIRDDMSAKITSDMGFRAGAAVHKNLADIERSYSTTVFNDHTSLDHTLESIDTDVRAITDRPNLSARDAAHIAGEIVPKLKERVAQAAFDGMAQRNAKEAIAALEHGDFDKYADAVTLAHWKNYAKAQDSAQRQDAERTRIDEKRQRDETANTALDEHITALKNGDKRAVSRAFADPRLAGYAHMKENVQAFSRQMEEHIENKPHPAERGRLQDLIFSTAMTNPDDVESLRKDILDSHKARKISNAEQVLLGNEITQAGDHLNQHIHRAVGDIAAGAARDLMSKALLSLPEQADAFAAGKLNYEAFVREEFRKSIAAGKSVTPLFDANNASSPLNPAVARSYLFPSGPKKAISDTAETARAGEPQMPPENAKGWKLMIDKAGNRAYVSPDKKQFEETPTGLKQIPASVSAPAAVQAPVGAIPKTYAEWSSRQESLRGAVDAKGWPWEPDRWNYSIDDKGQVQRELSPGREWLKANYEALQRDRENK